MAESRPLKAFTVSLAVPLLRCVNISNVDQRRSVGIGAGILKLDSRAVFLNRRAAARYRALASIIPGREGFSWNLSF